MIKNDQKPTGGMVPPVWFLIVFSRWSVFYD